MKLFIGPLVHTLNPTTIQYSQLSIIGVSNSGTIDFTAHHVEDKDSTLKSVLESEENKKKGWAHDKVEVVVLNHGEFLCPGFIDTHTHAPQFPNIGRGQQYELLDWLKCITFPSEQRLADTEYAKSLYNEVVRRVISFGTTTCCYYGSLHLEATKVLADECHKAGQRAFVGKCNMDRNGSPTYVERACHESCEDTKSLIAYIQSLEPLPTSSALVHPIITPRFAISCTDELLSLLGELATANPKMAIQTHISENATEIAYVKQLFPKAKNYTDVYDMHGLVREGTILGHACHLDEDEMDVIKQRNAGIAHCPTSNFNIRSGMAKVGKYLDRGIKVGLGTDCSGGYAPSILRTIQDACITSKILSLTPSDKPLTEPCLEGKHLPIATLLYLGTLGGADVCCIADKVGNFEVGKEFDAIIASVPGPTNGTFKSKHGGNPAVWYGDQDDLETLVEKFLFGGDDRNIKEVYVCGKKIGGWA
ncbi:guanine deaminase [Serendipita vermifera]|nr:guanine deaminase [Serendipita vermifera]